MTADALKRIRLDLGLSQSEFAKALGYNERSIRRWEKGEWPVPDNVMTEAQELLQVT